VNQIEFENQLFLVKEIEVPDLGNVKISTSTLNRLLLNNSGDYISETASIIDESIYFFVEDNQIDLTDDELLNILAIEVL
jgi:hypothetical protein